MENYSTERTPTVARRVLVLLHLWQCVLHWCIIFLWNTAPKNDLMLTWAQMCFNNRILNFGTIVQNLLWSYYDFCTNKGTFNCGLNAVHWMFFFVCFLSIQEPGDSRLFLTQFRGCLGSSDNPRSGIPLLSLWK